MMRQFYIFLKDVALGGQLSYFLSEQIVHLGYIILINNAMIIIRWQVDSNIKLKTEILNSNKNAEEC